MSIYKEWEFAQNNSNAERCLELALLGWCYRKEIDITCPFSVRQFVDQFIRTEKIPLAKFQCPKPASGHPDIVLKMRELPYGALWVAMAQRWMQAHQ